MLSEIEEEINQAVKSAESTPRMSPDSSFEYMATELSPRLQAQRADLLRYTNEKR